MSYHIISSSIRVQPLVAPSLRFAGSDQFYYPTVSLVITDARKSPLSTRDNEIWQITGRPQDDENGPVFKISCTNPPFPHEVGSVIGFNEKIRATLTMGPNNPARALFSTTKN